jgi:thiol-disulfide isomerase/thioredoxin
MKLVKFSADWCGPCKLLSATIDGIKDTIPYVVEDIDADSNLELVKKYNVRNIPTLLLLDDDGNEVKRKLGNMTLSDLKSFLSI